MLRCVLGFPWLAFLSGDLDVVNNMASNLRRKEGDCE